METDIEGSIRATIVPDSDRLQTLPRHFGRHMMAVESGIFSFLRELCPSYQGGLWQFIELSNGGFFMYPRGLGRAVLGSQNGSEEEMSEEAAGITACLFAFSHLSFRYNDERIAEHYHWLREFACEHAEHEQILSVID